MTDYKRWNVQTWLGLIGLVLIVGSLPALGIVNYFSPDKSVPKGVITTATGTITGCHDEKIQKRRISMPSGFPTYTFVYNAHTYTGENPAVSNLPCSDTTNQAGSTVTVYFVQSDPTQSALTQGPLYVVQSSPWYIVPEIMVGIGFVLVLVTVVALSKARRKSSP